MVVSLVLQRLVIRRCPGVTVQLSGLGGYCYAFPRTPSWIDPYNNLFPGNPTIDASSPNLDILPKYQSPLSPKIKPNASFLAQISSGLVRPACACALSRLEILYRRYKNTPLLLYYDVSRTLLSYSNILPFARWTWILLFLIIKFWPN